MFEVSKNGDVFPRLETQNSGMSNIDLLNIVIMITAKI